MKNNETGEFELVLGNRQLLSGFFIVVLLFGVAFAMGYIVGRNSTPSAKQQAEGGTSTTATATRPEPASAAPAPTPAAADSVPAQPAADQTPRPADQPPVETASAPTTQPATSGAPSAAPTAPVTAAPATVTPAAETTVPEAPPGSYWQVIATSNRTSADALLQSLKDKGFPVTLSPGPNNLVRVLVGPFTDTQALGRAKSRLEDAGFHPVRK